MVIALFYSAVLTGQAPVTEWSRKYGDGVNIMRAHSQTRLTPDSGYIMVFSQDDSDGVVMKTDAAGNTEWKSVLGGSSRDHIVSVAPAPDGGYVAVGWTSSSDGDLAGLREGTDEDVWVIKLDAAGNTEWQRIYGGAENDMGWSIKNTPDGGYVVAGHSTSATLRDDRAKNNGIVDFLVIKLDKDGYKEWARLIGCKNIERAFDIEVDRAGGYAVVGHGISTGKGVVNKGAFDVWVVKLNTDGIEQWRKGYGGNSHDGGVCIVQSSQDNGFIIAGYSHSKNGLDDVKYPKPGTQSDIWVLKISSSGTLVWEKTYGGKGNDEGFSIAVFPAGGYILASASDSRDGDVIRNEASAEAASTNLIININEEGEVRWSTTWGKNGGNTNFAGNAEGTADGGFILSAGYYSSDEHVALTKFRSCDSKVFLKETICTNQSYKLGNKYYSEAGRYTAMLVSSLGCDSMVTVDLSMAHTYSVVLRTVTICEGTEYDFFGQKLADAGFYRHILKSKEGCDSILLLRTIVSPLPKPIITEEGNELIVDEFASYEWLLNGLPLKRKAGQRLTADLTGDYQVIVANSDGCKDTSDVHSVVITGFRNGEMMTGIEMRPNPAQHMVTVSYPYTDGAAWRIIIYSMDGRVVQQGEYSGEEARLNLENLCAGIYLMKIYQGGELRKTDKLMKR